MNSSPRHRASGAVLVFSRGLQEQATLGVLRQAIRSPVTWSIVPIGSSPEGPAMHPLGEDGVQVDDDRVATLDPRPGDQGLLVDQPAALDVGLGRGDSLLVDRLEGLLDPADMPAQLVLEELRQDGAGGDDMLGDLDDRAQLTGLAAVASDGLAPDPSIVEDQRDVAGLLLAGEAVVAAGGLRERRRSPSRIRESGGWCRRRWLPT